MKTFKFKIVYALDSAFANIEPEDSGLRSQTIKVTAEDQEEAEESITDSFIEEIQSLELLSVTSIGI